MTQVVGVILAGGRSSRMGGGDKPLLPLGSATILDHVVQRFAPQVEALAINLNGDPSRFASYGLPVIPDTFGHFDGPLAGILAALRWGTEQGAARVITVAGDTPFLPADLAGRLAEEAAPSEIAVATSDGRTHPTAASWPVELHEPLARFLADQTTRRVLSFVQSQPHRLVAFSTAGGDPFFNVNTPSDLEEAQQRALLP
ncbi:molybdenum cofactor guanylyltransferase MobA [Tianweitania sediminis]|uniref:Molybdenum cofactor guanylyltransferase n=1 Tax=Tianweitania sediminis TaxID=1502156 RepID=A0A8J7ULW9_9HYPH|nr:molybdenum cofactor guanylyltransferase MobA [Tianweitania sediminis]MBP0439732.1 molybdenum cofactor guanylyltransferase MobA [Tianweitania sediminis]